VSGLTGVGKTSILSHLSLDYVLQGVRTLWGSFELQIPKLAKKMLCQFSGKNIEKDKEGYDEIADQFAALPLYFLRFFGSTEVDQVVDAMDYAVYVHDVSHVIIDNIQFMISQQGKGSEKFELMDEAINKFRKFATDRNVHITLVIHPRKQDPDVALAVSDIFGNAKATQEADNVIIFQQGKQHKYLDIKKNRFTGDLGKIALTFDKESQRFLELSTTNKPTTQTTTTTTTTQNPTAPTPTTAQKSTTPTPQKPAATTTQKPAATTQKPAATPQKSAPAATTPQKPAATPQKPATTTQKPPTTTQKLAATTTQKPAATPSKSAATTQKPAATPSKPAATTTQKPATPPKPAATPPKPAATSTQKPTAQKPTTPRPPSPTTTHKPASTTQGPLQ